MNILIVDDEPIIRIGLRTLIDWPASGLTLLGEASDGEEALRFLESNDVDIVVTDIRMPRMDGLELIRRASATDRELGVLVLSCLDDFAFVKEAMKLGAHDYILKPTMEPDQLLEVLQAVGEHIRHRRAEKERLLRLDEQLRQSRPYQLEANIRSWLEHGGVAKELNAQLFAGEQRVYSFMLCGKHVRQTLAAQERRQEWLAAVELHEHQLLLLYALRKQSSKLDFHRDSFADAAALLARIGASAYAAGNDYFVCVAPPMSRLEELPERIALHRQQALHRFYAAEPEAVVHSFRMVEADEGQLPLDIRNDLLRAVAGSNEEAMLHQAQLMIEAIRAEMPDPAKLTGFVFETLGLMIGYARDNGYAGMDDYEQQYLLMERIQACQHVEATAVFVRGAVRALWACRLGLPAQTSSSHPFVRKAVQYMKQHYSHNITTADIAEHVRLSRSYLSDLYSKETGESLIETLSHIRIEEAQRLLKSGGKKMYEIAEIVGFADSKTFARAFKRIAGCTPKEYEAANKTFFV